MIMMGNDEDQYWDVLYECDSLALVPSWSRLHHPRFVLKIGMQQSEAKRILTVW